MSKTAQSDKSSQKTKSPKKTEIHKDFIDRIVKTRTFEPFDQPTVGCRFIRFRRRGESVEGVLGRPIVNFRQGASYPLTLDNGEVVEVVGNKVMHKLIREGELIGRRVEILYVGRQFTGGGRQRKIFRVFKLDY